jgi:hypothetical protein
MYLPVGSSCLALYALGLIAAATLRLRRPESGSMCHVGARLCGVHTVKLKATVGRQECGPKEQPEQRLACRGWSREQELAAEEATEARHEPGEGGWDLLVSILHHPPHPTLSRLSQTLVMRPHFSNLARRSSSVQDRGRYRRYTSVLSTGISGMVTACRGEQAAAARKEIAPHSHRRHCSVGLRGLSRFIMA